MEREELCGKGDGHEGNRLWVFTRNRGRTKVCDVLGDLGGSGLGGLGGCAEGLIDGDIDKGIEMGVSLLAGNGVEEARRDICEHRTGGSRRGDVGAGKEPRELDRRHRGLALGKSEHRAKKCPNTIRTE